MRIWSVHPSQLDRAALIACWRETLLAQAVLAGKTKGYTQHPQLVRFRAAPEPLAAVGAYLGALADEADARGYTFNRGLVLRPSETVHRIEVTQGQLEYEWAHLGAKFEVRSPGDFQRWRVSQAQAHPLFLVVPGDVESWERTE